MKRERWLTLVWQWIMAELRQLRYPPEFRIEAVSVSPELTTSVHELLNRLQALFTVTPKEDEKLLTIVAELATGLWRVRNRVRTLPEGDESIRRLKRVMEAVWEAMEANNVKVQEHTGEDYDEGMALEVLDVQTNPSLARAKVVETVKPSIFVNGRLVQWGIVIIGKPPERGGD